MLHVHFSLAKPLCSMHFQLHTLLFRRLYALIKLLLLQFMLFGAACLSASQGILRFYLTLISLRAYLLSERSLNGRRRSQCCHNCIKTKKYKKNCERTPKEILLQVNVVVVVVLRHVKAPPLYS